MKGVRKGLVPCVRWCGTLLVFELILTDHFACVSVNLCRFKLPALPSLQKFHTFFGKYVVQVSIFPACYQYDSASWQLHTEMVPVHGVTMDELNS